MKRKVAVITGGATGIGRRTAIELAKQGISVVVTYRSSRREADALVSELQSLYQVEALAIAGDAASETACKAVVETIMYTFGQIDILIHNAGPYIRERKRMTDYSSEEWHYMMNGNLNSFFYMAKEILPYMRANQWGRVITLGFDRCETAPGWIYRSAFAAAKSGLTSLMKTLALEEISHRITVNMVSPGDIVPAWKEKDIESAKTVNQNTEPIGRPGTGEDIARVIAFLCDEKSDFITGAIIPVTGGQDVLTKVYRGVGIMESKDSHFKTERNG